MKKNTTSLQDGGKKLVVGGLLAAATCACAARADSSDALIETLLKKGMLTQEEAKDLKTEASADHAKFASASKWKLSSGIKSVELFGDARFRYEYREAEAIPTVAAPHGDTFARERFRYAVRVGLRGDLTDNFYFGLRLETGQNSRSSWVTFGDEPGFNFPGPSSKSSDGINLGQAYVGWRTTEWMTLEVGKMANPLYTTAMVWDGDINPEGAAERFKYTVDKFDLFATFGQFLYQDADPDNPVPGVVGLAPNKSDSFLLAWQLGTKYNLSKDMFLKFAATLYNYTGHGARINTGFSGKFVGDGTAIGANPYDPTAAFFINQSGINNLMIFEAPGEFNFKLGQLTARLFGDFAMNLDGSKRAAAAGHPKLSDEDKAYQVGFAIGNIGLVSGQTAKKGTWEARTYVQRVEQFALDVNLLDSDFFEGRGNLQGVYVAVAYSLSDNIIATMRYGYADRFNKTIGTGGSNQDLPQLNPITKYQILQLDLTFRF